MACYNKQLQHANRKLTKADAPQLCAATTASSRRACIQSRCSYAQSALPLVLLWPFGAYTSSVKKSTTLVACTLSCDQ
eukprot:19159-Heterococcus_DN1.PRE.8